MQRLFEIIELLEQKIPLTPEAGLPSLYLAIADHLQLANAGKQRFYLDKILDNLLLSTTDEIRIKAEIQLVGIVFNQMKVTDALSIADQALAKAISIGHPSLVLQAKAQRSACLLYCGKADEAVALADDYINEVATIKDIELLRVAYTFASYIYTDKDTARAGTYAMKALAYAKQTGNNWLIGNSYAVLGFWARNNKVEQDAYMHFKEAAKYLAPEGAHEYYGTTLLELSTCEKDRKNFDLAEQCIEKAIAAFTLTKHIRFTTMGAIALARLYRAQKKYDLAIAHYKNAIAIAEEHQIDYENAAAHGLLAQLYAVIDQPELAVHYLEKSLEIYGEKIRPSAKADISKHLHGLYHKVGKIDKAYTTLLDYVTIRLQIQDENRIKETAQLQAKYEAEKREAELKEARLQQTESELKALKAQMNPHFIFNALNSIQEIFFLGDKRLANKHLSNFSQLTRKILHASTKTSITLQEEIETLEQYLGLEALRFSDNFDYQMSIAENIDPYLIEVPPMLLQPFVENAIKHGLMHKDENRKLAISFKLKEHTEETALLQVSIKDNGIGRAASAAINANKARIGQSFASEATEKRLSLLNLDSDESVRYIDLEENGKPAGTEVLIAIPIKQ